MIDCFTEGNALASSCGAPGRVPTTWSCISSATRRATTTCGRIWSHYPGLVVLHDARLHQARARRLLESATLRRLSPRISLRPPRRAAGISPSTRSKGWAGLIYYFWSNAARGRAHGADGRGAQPPRRRRSCATSSRRSCGHHSAGCRGRFDATRRRGRAAPRGPRHSGRRRAVRRLRQDHRGETYRGDRCAPSTHWPANGQTSTCCWQAMRQTTREFRSVLAATRHADRVHVTGYVPDHEVERVPARGRMPACACVGRPRSRRRRPGCSASLPGGRP